MASTPKSKKSKTKPKDRPSSTTALTQPVVEEDSSNLTSLSSFSPNGSLFAFLSLAVDRHRLRVYDTTLGNAVAEYTVDSGRVTALEWLHLDSSEWQGPSDEAVPDHPSKKKRKSRQSLVVGDPTANYRPRAIEVVGLGLSTGSLELFSPSHGQVLRTLFHSKSASSILSVATSRHKDSEHLLWTSSADGTIRLWNARKNEILDSWKSDDRIPYSTVAIQPASSPDGPITILVASHAIQLLSTTSHMSKTGTFDTSKAKVLATFTGHASSITSLLWDASQEPSRRFLSMAQGDRFIYFWGIPHGSASSEGKIIASIPLDSDARAMSFSITNLPSPTGRKQSILSVSASGKISIFPVSTELTNPFNSQIAQHKIPTLLSRSNITVSSKKGSSSFRILNASFTGEEGRIRIARLFGGVRLVFDLIDYLDGAGNFIQDVKVTSDQSALEASPQGPLIASKKRYAESSSVAIRSGADLGENGELDDLALQDVDGNLDVDMTELTLGERLAVVSGVDLAGDRGSNSDEDVDELPSTSASKQQNSSRVPANSLARTLIQALHSSDSRLLETCLAHSEQALIRNTVRRLPPALVVPLLTACVDRLGKGGKAASSRGRGGANSQRGSGLITWVKTVLIIHSGHLMTMPDLIARLSGLHAILSSRLALQQSLLALSGRLDTVLAQIEMRSSTAPASLSHKGKNQASNGKAEAMHYVEGESDDDDGEQMDVEVENEGEGDADSIEDIELGRNSDGDIEDDEDEEEEDSEDSEEEDDESDLNGFIDDEAEESEDEEDSN